MKKLFVILLFTICCHIVSAQHYGGIYISPLWTKNSILFNSNKSDNKNYTLGYSVGYQGLIMPKRRFSFSYGLQYGYQYVEEIFKNESKSAGTSKNIVGLKTELQTLEIPAAWRYNILKDKKLQPYLSVSTTFVMPVSHKIYSINEDKEYEFSKSVPNSLFISADLGAGLNYSKNNWIFNVQGTMRLGNYWKQLSLGFSVMRKF